MNVDRLFDVVGSALDAQRQRLNIISGQFGKCWINTVTQWRTVRTTRCGLSIGQPWLSLSTSVLRRVWWSDGAQWCEGV